MGRVQTLLRLRVPGGTDVAPLQWGEGSRCHRKRTACPLRGPLRPAATRLRACLPARRHRRPVTRGASISSSSSSLTWSTLTTSTTAPQKVSPPHLTF
jgi:hypothetical protein